MKTLLKHNKGILDSSDLSESKLNGIECPNCTRELFDILNDKKDGIQFHKRDTTINLTMSPIYCNNCGYISARLVKL